MLCGACHATPPSKRPADKGNAVAASTHGTIVDDIDVHDTVEDPAYVVAGEQLAQDVAATVVGQTAPTAVMTTIDGETIDLGSIYGTKPVYIKFWATWCVPCRQQMPAFEKFFETHGDKIQVIALNIGLSDDEASVRALRDTYGLKMPIVMDDGSFAGLFHLSVTPQHMLIGKDARFAYVGHAEGPQLAEAITNVLTTTTVAKPAQAFTAPKKASALHLGDSVPTLSVTTIAGATIALGGARPGKIRVVEFFSSWCEWYLEKTRPKTSQACAGIRQQIATAVTNSPDVEWLGIAGGPWATAQDLVDYQKKNAVTIPLALDKSGDLFRAFGIRDIPTIVIIDGAGRIANVLAAGDTDLAAAIRAVQAQQR